MSTTRSIKALVSVDYDKTKKQKISREKNSMQQVLFHLSMSKGSINIFSQYKKLQAV